MVIIGMQILIDILIKLSYNKGIKKLNIITGKGLRSKNDKRSIQIE